MLSVSHGRNFIPGDSGKNWDGQGQYTYIVTRPHPNPAGIRCEWEYIKKLERYEINPSD